MQQAQQSSAQSSVTKWCKRRRVYDFREVKWSKEQHFRITTTTIRIIFKHGQDNSLSPYYNNKIIYVVDFFVFIGTLL